MQDWEAEKERTGELMCYNHISVVKDYFSLHLKQRFSCTNGCKCKGCSPHEPQFTVCEQGISYNSVIVQASMQPLNLQSDLISRNQVSHIHSSSDIVLQHIFYYFLRKKRPPSPFLLGKHCSRGAQCWSEMLHCSSCMSVLRLLILTG